MAQDEHRPVRKYSLHVPGGGSPYRVTATANGQGIPEPVYEAVRRQARRLVEFTAKIAS